MYANTLSDPAMSDFSEAVFINNVKNVLYDTHKSHKFYSCLGRILLFRNERELRFTILSHFRPFVHIH